MTKGPLVREIVFEALTEILEENRHCHVILAKALDKYQYLEKPDRSLIKRMVHGTVEYRLTIDHILNLYSKVKTEKMKPAIRTILRMSAYQILYLDRVPDFAVCNEAFCARFPGIRRSFPLKSRAISIPCLPGSLRCRRRSSEAVRL